MAVETWHAEFNPQKFLSGVDLGKLIERNKTYNEVHDSQTKSPCILCDNTIGRGILLNDRSFLCERCYVEVAMITYPEKYEALYRKFKIEQEARRLAWESFRERYEHHSKDSSLTFLGWASLLLAFFNLYFLLLTAALLAAGYGLNFLTGSRPKNGPIGETSGKRRIPPHSNPNSDIFTTLRPTCQIGITGFSRYSITGLVIRRSGNIYGWLSSAAILTDVR